MSEEAGRCGRSQASEHNHMIDPLHVNPLFLTVTSEHNNHRSQFTTSFQKSQATTTLEFPTHTTRGQLDAAAYERTDQPAQLLSWPAILPTASSYFDTTPFTGGYFPQPSVEHDQFSESSYTESDCFTNYTGTFSTAFTTSDSSQPQVGEHRNEAGKCLSPQTRIHKKVSPATCGNGIQTPIKARKAKSRRSGQSRTSALEDAFRSYSDSPTFGGLRQLIDEAMSYGEHHPKAMSTCLVNTGSASEATANRKGIQDFHLAADDVSITFDTSKPYDVASKILASERTTDVPQSSHASPQFTCTFHNCDQMFAAYSDWKRHEENQDHYPQERFMCLRCLIPDGNEVQNTFCEICLHRFCLKDDLEAHYRLCLPLQDKPKFTFTRKYHLNNHLRRQHSVGTAKANELSGHWKYALSNNWPRDCHICHVKFKTWDERMKHIAKHFHRGEGRPPGFNGGRDDESDEDEDDNDHKDDGPPRKRFRSNPSHEVSTTELKSQGQWINPRDTQSNSPYAFHTHYISNVYNSRDEHVQLKLKLEKFENPQGGSLTKEATSWDQDRTSLLRSKTVQQPLALPRQRLNWNRLFVLDRYLNDEDDGMQNWWNWSDVPDSGEFAPPPLPPSLPRRSVKFPKRTVKVRASFKPKQLRAAKKYLAQHVRTLPNGVFWFNSKVKQNVKDSFWDIAIQAVQTSPKDNPTILHLCDSWWTQEGATIAPTIAMDCTHLVISAYKESDIVHLELTLDKLWEKMDKQDQVQDLRGLQVLFKLYIEKSRAVFFAARQVYSAALMYTKSTRQFIDFLIHYKRSFHRKFTTKALAIFLESETAMLDSSDQLMQSYLEKECLRRRLLYLKKSDLRLLSVCHLRYKIYGIILTSFCR
jgi:hypothetical protein